MANSVRWQPNHYETLGLAPSATDKEIGEAFARKMSECSWQPMGASAQICIAYETLSNRFKRADYDRALGLVPKPQPRLATMAIVQERWAPFIASTPTNALGQAARDAAPELHVTAQSHPNAGSRVAESLRELAKPVARDSSSAAFARSRERQTLPEGLDSQAPQIPEALLAEEASTRDSDERVLDLKGPALAIGGFVLAAGLIGAFAGLSLKDDEGSSLTQPPAAVAAPVPRPQPNAAAALVVPPAPEREVNAAQGTVRLTASKSRWRPSRWRRHKPLRVRQRVSEIEAAESRPVVAQPNIDTASQAVSDAPVAQPVPASIPH